MSKRVLVRANGEALDWWTDVEITRDLSEICGSFLLGVHDIRRARDTIRGPLPRVLPRAIDAGAPVQILIDNELVLDGYIDEVKLAFAANDMKASVAGRDRAGDLVDCAATVDGPTEYRDLPLEEIVRRICAPFGISVRAEAGTGAPLPIFSIDAAERAMEAIERACRQRAILAVSDGVGGLVLTQGGRRRGPDGLTLPGNVLAAVVNRSWRNRHSEYLVKGQTRAIRSGGPAFVRTASPLTPGAPPSALPAQRREADNIVMTGRARDALITRYRPSVRLSKSQSGGNSVQTQADFALRVARGAGETLTYTVVDWRAGPDNRLWRPNEIVVVDDPFGGILGEMLVVAVSYIYSEREGSTTRLTLAGPSAFDQLPEPDDRRAARERRNAARVTTATPLRPS